MKAPTIEQCQSMSELEDEGGATPSFALLTPQAKSIIRLTDDNRGFHLLVWHDGKRELPDDAVPYEIRGGDVEQVQRFAAALTALQERARQR